MFSQLKKIISATPNRVPTCPSAWRSVNPKSTSDPSFARLVLISKQFALSLGAQTNALNCCTDPSGSTNEPTAL